MNSTGKPKVLLVGWDAADWEHIHPLLDAGLLPTLESLIQRGAMGNLRTLQPVLSPMLWNSIATGKQPYKHGVHGFVEPDRQNGGARPWSSNSRKTKALWNILSQHGLRCNVINWWASHPAEKINGCVVSNLFNGVKYDPRTNWTIARHTVHPEAWSADLAPNKVFPNELTGEQLLPFVPKGKEVNQDDDQKLSVVANNLAEMLSTHAVATAVLERSEWDFSAIYYTAIDHFCHAFMHYHPPRLPWVPEADFEIYQHVITAAYRFSDMMLHRLIQMAGPDAHILLCSDHGFQSRELRPRIIPNEPAGPAWWHRRFGVFLAAGPGIRQDQRIYGASLLDVAPTILSLFGLPIGADMDGRVLTEIFETPPVIRNIPSWDLVPGESGMHTGEVEASPEEAAELLHQFAALGYIDSPSDSKEEQFEMADVEAKYNLGRNLMSCDRNREALDLWLELAHRRPWESRFIILLAKAFLACGYPKWAEQVIAAAYDLKSTRDPAARLVWAEIQVAQGAPNAGFDALRISEKFQTGTPEFPMHLGVNYLKLRKFDDAERMFRTAIGMHPENAEAYQGLATVCIRKGDNQGAADNALAAVGLVFGLPRAHLILGIALTRSGEYRQATAALENALQLNPDMRKAHRYLAFIHTRYLPDPEKAAYHRQCLRQLEIQPQIPTPQTSFDLPKFPSEKERFEMLKSQRPVRGSEAQKSGKSFVLVSGLPRSGTSLMMQMLEAGGLPPKTDGQRLADVDNPKGYYEWEEIKAIQRKPEILDEPGLENKAIKVISMLIPQMPYRHHYKVIFMNRAIDEVVRSQSEMIKNRDTEGAQLETEQLARSLAEHREQIVRWLGGHPRAECLVVDYSELLAKPSEQCGRIAEFLGSEKIPHPEKMAAAIDPALYRNRT